ncbi:glutathione S-transferase family protein [Trinickia mobilis]|uniref:glutathione S-transferase family protein n=1 Tax=Trinickia mobilis TaxID=2816356 RepID=UPI001A90AC85|nr:glutathione S-transferase family protein [Trinickia mobilis]
MATVVLHQWEASPFCGKVRKVLNHKGIRFTVVNYNGLLALKAKRLSRLGKLPVVDFDGERVQDSTDIVVFLEQRVPEPAVFPAEPSQRALACLLEDWADESLYWFEAALRMTDAGARAKATDLLCAGRPAWERIPFSIVVRHMYSRKLQTQGLGKFPASSIRERLLTHLTYVDALLADSPWLVGHSKSIADIAVAAQLDEIVRTSTVGPSILEMPRIADWLARCA